MNASQSIQTCNEQSPYTKQLALWTSVWVASTAVVAFGPKLVWDYYTPMTVIAMTLNVLAGITMILANRRHLRSLDELQQKIFLEASVLTLGVGLVFALAYELMATVKLISFQPEISHVVIGMSLIFVAAMIAGNRKYA